MEKGKRIEAESHLPEAIIQHIQSFLNGKEAARTTLLSKSWYAGWLTRPNLDFNQKDFVRKSGNLRKENVFFEFLKKTLERYEKLNLSIDSLRLWIHGSLNANHSSYSLVKKLIMQALKMGATGLDFKMYYRNRPFTLPHEVFRSENLMRLSVNGCKIGVGADGKVSCSGLKSLTLEKVTVEGGLIWDIILSCPLIENLSLSTSNVQFEKRNVGSVVDRPIIRYEFRKLKCLLLSRIDLRILCFHGLFSKLPCLKDLNLHHCVYYKVIEISSLSLECINFIDDTVVWGKFDVPSLRKLTFSGSRIPLLFPKTTAIYCQSDISIKLRNPPNSDTWFLELNRLLKMLSRSKVSLSLKIASEKSSDYESSIQGLRKPKVENLTINGPYSVCPALFYSLFRCCRPIYISQYWIPESCIGKKNYDYMEFIYKKMMQQVSLNCCIAYQRKFGESDLEKVSVEFYDEGVSAWRPRLLDTSTSPGADEHKIRLHLRWRRTLVQWYEFFPDNNHIFHFLCYPFFERLEGVTNVCIICRFSKSGGHLGASENKQIASKLNGGSWSCSCIEMIRVFVPFF